MLEEAGATLMNYAQSPVVETFNQYEAEYAALRKGVGLYDANQKSAIKLTGKDRADFLHRLATQDVNSVKPGQATRAFVLLRHGRILADILIIAGTDHHFIILDRSDASSLIEHLDHYLIADDVQLHNLSASHHIVGLHGPQAALLLNELGGQKLHELTPLATTTAQLAGVTATVVRTDFTGSMGFDLIIESEQALTLFQAIAQLIGGLVPDVQGGVRRRITGRGIGWMALNTARIEAGHAVFHIDFGPDSLPHETGTECMESAVSFKKGCYLGQEIVVRMHHLGNPKKILMGLSLPDDRLPLAGAQVFDADGATIIGAVTSSCLSPLKGNQAIALAIVKWGKHNLQTPIKVTAEGALVDALACQHHI